ncbi:tellurite resistance TerB family protein [Pseudomonas sp. ADAK18]|uniref:DUF533 domain-containing protein n=1 Tax=Pseudomonas sp. ADAK18 TaxID=2730848 RepID=UPI001464527C|nr:DUF533 domain-containing protein [Pseudomonas sp. ADAK18]QJI28988.1 tellurite resistance TerB family protein [Pseudomonas sp. ADAK18]
MNTSDLLEKLLQAGQASMSQQGGSTAAPQGSSGGLGGLGGLLGGLGGLLQGGGAGGAASGGGGLGGLGGLLGGLGGLGGLLGGSSAGNGAQGRSGGTNYAALASLGMMAYQAYQTWQSQQASAPQQALQTVDQLSGAEVDEHSHAILRALIAAAKADGKIDDQEQAMISAELARHTDEPELKAWLDAEVALPLKASDFSEYAQNPAIGSEIYLASVMLVNDQQPAERGYLDELAVALNIEPEFQVQLERQAKGQA